MNTTFTWKSSKYRIAPWHQREKAAAKVYVLELFHRDENGEIAHDKPLAILDARFSKLQWVIYSEMLQAVPSRDMPNIWYGMQELTEFLEKSK